ncbi:hypothetical protein GSF70_13620 [Flavobacteriaceae bacterium W22]|nr:hypothetical protein [Flavobacteriaceae bacterium W22]
MKQLPFSETPPKNAAQKDTAQNGREIRGKLNSNGNKQNPPASCDTGGFL